MKIDGKSIAQEIFEEIIKRVGELNTKNITPTLAVILVGNDPGSENYVRQKQIHSEKVGIKLILKRFENVTLDQLKPAIDELNSDPQINGIIIQRPLDTISDQDLDSLVTPEKDVDGFHPQSKFAPPVAKAVVRLLKDIHPENFESWIKSQKIVVIGKGRTAGGPILKYLRSDLGVDPFTIDSKTLNPERITRTADILISAVGKKDAVRKDMINKPILIGVGLHMEDGKLKGDFDEEIALTLPYYSGTPGGVGPVNVAMLLKNVIDASFEQKKVDN